jgi:hypothetical protein
MVKEPTLEVSKVMPPMVRPESIVIGLPDVPTVPTAVLKVAVSVEPVADAPEDVLPGAVFPPQFVVELHDAEAPVEFHV